MDASAVPTKIAVGVRLRPLLSQESEEGATEAVCVGPAGVVVDKAAGREYPYDHVYGADVATSTVFDAQGRRIVHGVVDGYNCTLFAYGQTSSGKTFTITGAPSSPGLLHLCVAELFASLAAHSASSYVVRASCVEIYNEALRDLLEPSNTRMTIYEDPIRGASVRDVTEVSACSAGEAMAALERGMANRTIGSTAMNDQSSRSHTIYRLVVESRPLVLDAGAATPAVAALRRRDDSAPSTPKTRGVGTPRGMDAHADGDVFKFPSAAAAEDAPRNLLRAWPASAGPAKAAVLNLVDLAGSERASKAKSSGTRLKEGASINRSLLTLGQVIAGLARLSDLAAGAVPSASAASSPAPATAASVGGSPGLQAADGSPVPPPAGGAVGVHIPYRDSKLTRLLQNSLGGNARTAIIANVSPASTQVEETRSTLMFASRARKIVNRPVVNETPEASILAAQYKMEVNSLRQQNDQLAAERAALQSRLDTELVRASDLARAADESSGSARIDALQRVILASSDVMLNIRGKRNSAVYVARIAQRLSDVGRGADDMQTLAEDAERAATRLRAHHHDEAEDGMLAEANDEEDGPREDEEEDAEAVLAELLPLRLRSEDEAADDSTATPSAAAASVSAAAMSWPEPVAEALTSIRDASVAGSAVDADAQPDTVAKLLRDCDRSAIPGGLSVALVRGVPWLLQHMTALQSSTVAQEMHLRAVEQNAVVEKRSLRRQASSVRQALAAAAAEVAAIAGGADGDDSDRATASSDVSSTLELVRERVDVVRRRLTQREQEMTYMKHERDGALDRALKAEAEARMATSARAAMDQKYNESSAALAAIRNEAEQAQHTAALLRSQLEDAQGVHAAALQAERDAASQARQRFERALQEKEAQLQAAVTSHASSITAMQAQLDTASREHADKSAALQAQLDIVNDEQATTLSVLRATEARLQDAASAAAQIEQLSGEQIAAAQAAAKNAQTAEATARAALDAAQARVTELEADLHAATELSTQLSAELQAANEQAAEARTSAHDAQAALQVQLEAVHDQLQQEQTEAAARHAELTSSLTAVTALHAEVDAARLDAVNQLEALRAASSASDSSAQQQLAAAIQRETALQAEAAQAHAHVSVLTAELEAARAATQNDAAAAASRAAAAVAQLNEKLVASEAECHELRAQVTAAAEGEAAAGARVAAAEARLVQEQQRARSYEAAVDDATQTCEALKSALAEKDSVLAQLQTRLDDLERRAESNSQSFLTPQRMDATSSMHALAVSAVEDAAAIRATDASTHTSPASSSSPASVTTRVMTLASGGSSAALKALATSPGQLLEALQPGASPRSTAQILQTFVLDNAVTNAHEQAQSTIQALLARIRELEQQLAAPAAVAHEELHARLHELELARDSTGTDSARLHAARVKDAATLVTLIQQRDAALDLVRRGSLHIHSLTTCINGLRSIAAHAGAPTEELQRLLVAASRIIGDARTAESLAARLNDVSAATSVRDTASPVVGSRSKAASPEISATSSLFRELREMEHAAFAADNDRLTRELATARSEMEGITKHCVQLAQRLVAVSGTLEVTVKDRDAAVVRCDAAVAQQQALVQAWQMHRCP